LLFQYPSRFVAHVARFRGIDAAFAWNLPASGQAMPPGRCGSGQKGAEHE
jgi:hypothetical protein